MHRVNALVGQFTLSGHRSPQLRSSPTSFVAPENRVVITMQDHGIALVRLNRPNKKNALDLAMFRALAEAGKYLKALPGLNVVVLTGEGSSFCSGLDLSAMQSLGGKDAANSNSVSAIYTPGGYTHLAQQVVWVWQELEVPVIAAVTGYALGGGCQLALGADIRFATPDSKWSVRELHWGLIPDMAGTYLLSRLVRDDVAKELVLTARLISGTRAHEVGLVSHLVTDPLARALQLATEMASRSPEALRAAKRLLNRSKLSTPAEQFREERREIGLLIGSPNQIEAVMAGMQKRSPNFSAL